MYGILIETLYLLKGSNSTSFLTLVFASVFLISIGFLTHEAFADTVTTTMPMQGPPGESTANPNTNLIYVQGYGNGWIAVINGSTDSIVSEIPLTSDHQGYPLGIATNPNTNKIYADDGRGIEVIDGASNSIVATIPISCSGDVAVNPNTNEVYVSNHSGNSVCVIDGSTNAQVGSILVAPNPRGIEVNAVTDKIYVVSAGGYRAYQAAVSVIDGSTNTVIKTIPIQCFGKYVGVNSNTNKIYATTECYFAYVIDGSNDTAVKIPLSLWSVGADPNTNKVYASDSNVAGQIDIINGTTDTVISTLQVSSTYFNLLSVNPVTNKIYVSLASSPYADLDNASSVVVIDGRSPTAPTNLAATAVSSSQINLKWNPPAYNGGSPITNYQVYRYTDPFSQQDLGDMGNVTSYNDTTVSSGVTYYYFVIASNSAQSSSPSNTASATTNAVIASGIVLDNVQSTSGTTSNQITMSGFNAGTGSNNLLLVGISANNNSPVSVTFNGVQLTQAVGSFYNNDAEFWYLKNPTGTGDITVTMGGPTQTVVGAYSFSGVNQTAPIATHVVKHNTTPNSPNISITTKYANDLVLDLPSIYGGSTLGSPTCTQQWDLNVPNAITGASSSTVVPSPATVTCKWTASSADFWDDVAVELRAAG